MGISQEDIQISFEEDIKKIKNSDLERLLIVAGAIPDEYSQDSSQEKIFTKLSEILVKEALDRICTAAHCVRTKSNFQDVTIHIGNKVVVSDVKSFRLSRSQNAPNVKDVIKPESYEKWLNRFDDDEKLGGLCVYPCTHEWDKISTVYELASNQNLPIVLLPYKYIAYLLRYSRNYKTEDLISLWDYTTIFSSYTKYKEVYWRSINNAICKLTKTDEKVLERFLIGCKIAINNSIKKYHDVAQKYCEVVENEDIEEIYRNMTKEQLIKILSENHKEKIRYEQFKVRRIANRVSEIKPGGIY